MTSQDRHAGIIEEYEAHLMRLGYAPGTVAQRVARLRALPVSPEVATSDDVLASLPADAMASTKRIYLTALRNAYRDLETMGLVSHDPTVGLRLPKPGRRLPKPLTDEQVDLLVSQTGRERDWTVLGCYLGTRAADVVNMYREDLFQTRSGWAVRLHGKGDVEAVVPAHPLVVDVIQRGPQRGPLWRLRADSMSQTWGIWAYDLGVEARYHMCRHTYGTRLYALTQDLLLTRDLMRHTSVATTQIYTAVEAEAQYKAVSGL